MPALLLRAFLATALVLCPVLVSAQSLRVVARVNDEAITDFDLNERIVFAVKSSGLQDTPDMRQRLAPQILRQMIDEKLQVQNAKALGLAPSDGEVAARVSEIEHSAGMAPGTFKAYLHSIGVPFDIAAQQIEASIAWAKIVRRKIRPHVDVSDTEIDDALNRVRKNVGKTEAHVAEIFVPIDRPDQADEARRSADRIVEQIRRGAPFAALAQQFSQGQTARNGGDLGWILPGSLDSALDAAIEKLPLRQVSEPIRTASGWHIVYVIDRRPFATARPDDVRLNLVQMTLALPANATPEETSNAMADAQKAMAAVHRCEDLHAQSRTLKGATSGDLKGVRVGDLRANPQMYEELPKLQVGGTAGPFRVAEGLQVVALCSKEGAGGLPSRQAVAQQILLQKVEAGARRYMRDMRRAATIDIKRPS
ncbi:peptidylprolyl isomerase [Enhydrobacter sp.]|uniref:peptidylprolyl isomerase n=1 Tax=Enhydrobacter sp. TaxID=1894999 RepID=UPI00260C2505|nr:peptidylprolyl isomerase [Enhydrobacter sp.]WIM14210.1 MAG: Survival protein SurA precursor (Peptidyl-prolyl cis-trans isomerase SurA) [Enhydrobacter sp.]